MRFAVRRARVDAKPYTDYVDPQLGAARIGVLRDMFRQVEAFDRASFDPATGKSLWADPEVNRFPIPVARAFRVMDRDG